MSTKWDKSYDSLKITPQQAIDRAHRDWEIARRHAFVDAVMADPEARKRALTLALPSIIKTNALLKRLQKKQA